MTAAVVFRALKDNRIKLTDEDEFFMSEHAWRKGGAPSRHLGDVRAGQHEGDASTS